MREAVRQAEQYFIICRNRYIKYPNRMSRKIIKLQQEARSALTKYHNLKIKLKEKNK